MPVSYYHIANKMTYGFNFERTMERIEWVSNRWLEGYSLREVLAETEVCLRLIVSGHKMIEEKAPTLV
jgi:hypothetical protein